jgi:hypothetical protein
MGAAARANAARRARGETTRDAYPHVSKEEQEGIRKSWLQRAKSFRGMPRRRKLEWAEEVTTNALVQLNAQRAAEKQQVKPATGGLIIPRSSLLVTPDEVRQMAQRARS